LLTLHTPEISQSQFTSHPVFYIWIFTRIRAGAWAAFSTQ